VSQVYCYLIVKRWELISHGWTTLSELKDLRDFLLCLRVNRTGAYGEFTLWVCRLRLQECLRLRVKDIDFDYKQDPGLFRAIAVMTSTDETSYFNE
jgi:hypothetical protein